MSSMPTEVSDNGVYDDGYLRIEHENYYISCGGRSIQLPQKEFLILSRLALNPGRTIPSEQIWQHAWGVQTSFNARSLRVHIHRLRRKLSRYGISIDSMVNVGYRLSSDGEVQHTGQ